MGLQADWTQLTRESVFTFVGSVHTEAWEKIKWKMMGRGKEKCKRQIQWKVVTCLQFKFP